jgi:hypothetical protein
MGNTFEVWATLPLMDGPSTYSGKYEDKLIYGGESMLDAMCALYSEKKKGTAYVKFEWRGTNED